MKDVEHRLRAIEEKVVTVTPCRLFLTLAGGRKITETDPVAALRRVTSGEKVIDAYTDTKGYGEWCGLLMALCREADDET